MTNRGLRQISHTLGVCGQDIRAMLLALKADEVMEWQTGDGGMFYQFKCGGEDPTVWRRGSLDGYYHRESNKYSLCCFRNNYVVNIFKYCCRPKQLTFEDQI